MSQTNLELTNSTKHTAVWDVVAGVLGLPAFLVAYESRLFLLLEEQGPLAKEQVALQQQADLRATEAMLNVCVALGFLELNQGKYSNTETTKTYLLPTSLAYMGGVLDLILANPATVSIDSVRTAIKTGKTQVYGGEDIFESHAVAAEQAKTFTYGMHGLSAGPAQYWPNKLDLSKNKLLLDIGGGSGAHTLGALRQWAQLRGIIFDMPVVCEIAEKIAQEHQLADRLVTYPGDLWSDVFPVADIHFYSQIFHDWPEEKCRFLAEKSFKALPQGGRIVIHEILYQDNKSGPFIAAASSIAMLLWTEGRQYSGQELVAMLTQAGFVNAEVIPTFGYWSVVTAEKN